ncbi:hypothetical protein HY213_01445 [Candidatus Peregrinibacteria bacterium]|nr:hypothetical protein [Candidatus Peregrinibacteria bacterium]
MKAFRGPRVLEQLQSGQRLPDFDPRSIQKEFDSVSREFRRVCRKLGSLEGARESKGKSGD